MLLRRSTIVPVFAMLCSTTTQAVTLDEAIRMTLTTNPEVLIALHERAARDQALEQARGIYLPTVDLVADAGRERTDNVTTRARAGDDVTLTRREIELQATQRLFDGRETTHEVQRQTARVESASHAVVDTAERTALRVIDVYLEVLRRQELLRLSQENLESHISIQDQIRLRAEAGVGRRSDLDQIDSRVALANANVLADEFNLRDAESNYLRVVDQLPLDLTRPETPMGAMPTSMSEAETAALADHPVLRIADADVDATVAQHKAARSSYYPQFDMQWTVGFGEDLDGINGDDDELSILVRARWNLYRGGRDRARIRETAVFVDQAKEVRNRSQRQVVESVRLSWIAHEAALARLAPLKRRVESTKKTRDAYKKQFNIGQRALLDLLDTENEVTEAQRAFWNAQIDGHIAQYRVLTGAGRLLEALGIPRPGELLDSGAQSIAANDMDSNFDMATEPIATFEESTDVVETAEPTDETGAESALLTPGTAGTPADFSSDARMKPHANNQNAFINEASSETSFDRLRRTFMRTYGSKTTRLSMDLSLFKDGGTDTMGTNSAFVVAMYDPFVDSIVNSEQQIATSQSTGLILDSQFEDRQPRKGHPHLDHSRWRGARQ